MNFGGKRALNFEKKQNHSDALVKDENVIWENLGQGVRRKIMAHNEQLMLVKVDFKKGAVGSLHHHPHLQISYVSKGKFEVSIGEEKEVLQAGDVYFVKADKVHGVICLEDGELIDVFNPARADFL